MAEVKKTAVKRVAGKSKFRLPERPPRVVEANPLREILEEARAQEEALAADSHPRPPTPATRIAGVQPSSLLRDSEAKPRTTPAINSAGVSRPGGLEPTLEGDSSKSFEDFERRWAPIMRPGQVSVCRALFNMTYVVGATECFTSMPKLAAASGIKERQCYNVVGQLEKLGFIERPEIFNTPNKKGTIFRFYLSPQSPDGGVNRRYHIGSGEMD